jgi:hypothetical protein
LDHEVIDGRSIMQADPAGAVIPMSRIPGAIGALLLVASAVGCAPSTIVGPLEHQQEERNVLLERARRGGMATDVVEKVLPPLTPWEEQLAREQDSSCRSSYMWKNGLTWTGSLLIAAAGGVEVGGAIATGNSDTNGKVIFGVSAGTGAILGSILVAVGGIVQNGYTDRGCQSRMYVK